MPNDEIEKKNTVKKDKKKKKQIAIKRTRIKFDIKINENQILRDEIENKIQLDKRLKNKQQLKK
jgi:protein-disulfide isomerase